jgi:DNA-binding LacI/PurR family transcriptional regulator
MNESNVIYSNSKATRLSKQMLEEIQDGRYTIGSLLPSEHVLAQKYNVSRRTIRRAVEILMQKDRLVKLPQRGVLVSGSQKKASSIAQIAFLTPSFHGETTLFAQGIDKALDHDRFQLAAYSAYGDLKKYQKMVENVLDLRPAGVILQSVSEEICPVDGSSLADAGIPAVAIGSYLVPGLSCDRVCDHTLGTFKQIARFIIDQNLKKVGFVGINLAKAITEKIQILRQELIPAGITLPDDRIFIQDLPQNTLVASEPCDDLQRFIAQRQELGCEVLICWHDYIAAEVLTRPGRVSVQPPVLSPNWMVWPSSDPMSWPQRAWTPALA